MTFEPTKPVQTRDGRKARVICTNLHWYDGRGRPIVYLIMNGAGEAICTCDKDGRSTGYPADDLINIPEKRRVVGWVNIYDTPMFYRSKDEADSAAAPYRIGCIEIDQEYEVIQP